ncbi:Fungal specific transcription factor domain containing protein [Hyaloscypha variabilis]
MNQTNLAQYCQDPKAKSGTSLLDQNLEDQAPRSPPRKRQRIPSACEPCRRRKTRCDGNRPVCSLCLRRGSSQQLCMYRKDPTIDRRDLLEANWSAPPQPRTYSDDTTAQLSSNSRKRDAYTTSAVGSSPPKPSDAIRVASYLNGRTPSPPNEFYGSSTTAKLMHQARGIVDSTPRTSMDAEHLDHLVLPTRDLADMLLGIYWSKLYPVAAIIYKPAFVAALEGLWKPKKELRNTLGGFDLGIGTFGVSDSRTTLFHCALNAIFAWTCQFACTMLPKEERESLAQTFFLRSKKLLSIHLLDHGSLAHVQTLLLFALCIPSTLFPSQCWNIIGLACRMAQGIGLHVESSPVQRARCELEVRRRVWCACMIMDTSWSMVLGRPTISSYRLISLPTTTDDDECFNMDGLSEDTQRPSHIIFLAESVKLYVTLGKVLSTVYKSGFMSANDTSVKEGKSESFNMIMSLDEEISNWEETMPSWLHWERGIHARDCLPEPQRLMLSKQSNLLRARYLSVRIALHRPTFVRFCRTLGPAVQTHLSTSQTSAGKTADVFRNFRSSMIIQSSAACIAAAVDLVSLSHESALKRADTSWWYATFYIINAATILIHTESCLPMRQYFNYSEAHDSWLLCCDALRLLAEAGHSVDNVLNGLYAMRQQLIQSQVPTTGSNTTQDQTPEIDAEEASSTIRVSGPSQLLQQSLNLPTTQEPSVSDFPAVVGIENTSGSMNQPFIDFMMQDMNPTPFGLFDESWLVLQNGDGSLGFDAPTQVFVGLEQPSLW